jgi:hypothetical protein
MKSVPSLRYVRRPVRPLGETITDFVAFLWVEFGQPCFKIFKQTERMARLESRGTRGETNAD